VEPVKVAAFQAAPVLLDRDAKIGKVIALTEQVAAEGARLVPISSRRRPSEVPDDHTPDGNASGGRRAGNLRAHEPERDHRPRRRPDRRGGAHRRPTRGVPGGIRARVNPVLHVDQIPDSLPGPEHLFAPGYLEESGPWLEPGNTVVVAPDGTVLAGPVREREEILLADLDLRDVAAARRDLDPAGHYNRPEVFRLLVDTSPHPAVIATAGINNLQGRPR
jgi:hypothetical protein